MSKIFLHEPHFFSDEIKNISRCIKTGWVSTGGQFVSEFENRISKFTKSKCVLTNSGTSAIHLSLILSNVKKNEEVLVPTISFIATVNPVLYLGAHPFFLDCEKNSPNIDLNKLTDFLKNNTYTINRKTINKKTKRVIKAIIFTHVFGVPINLTKIN